MNLFNDVKENFKRQKNINDQILSNLRFKEMDISKIKFYPIDGDIDRMKLYGCYAGDKFIYQGKEYIVEKDDVEKLIFLPSYKKIDIEKYHHTEPPKKIKELWKKSEKEAKQRMYMRDFHPNDIIKSDLYQFTYISQDITKENSFHGGNLIGHIDGWKIKCIDTITPIRDLVMPDSFFGVDIVSADACFKDCYNIASIKHIPEKCFNFNRIQNMFDKSGLREIPNELKDNNQIENACGYALCIHNYKSVIKNLNPYNILLTAYGKVYQKEQALEKAKANLDRDETILNSEFSPYKKFEKISFEYDENPLTIITAVDQTGKLFAVNNTNFNQQIIVPFKDYFKQFENSKISKFSVNSFTQISPKEGIQAIISADKNKINYLNKELNIEKEKLSKKIQEEILKADKMQIGLNYKPSLTQNVNSETLQEYNQDEIEITR